MAGLYEINFCRHLPLIGDPCYEIFFSLLASNKPKEDILLMKTSLVSKQQVYGGKSMLIGHVRASTMQGL